MDQASGEVEELGECAADHLLETVGQGPQVFRKSSLTEFGAFPSLTAGLCARPRGP